MPTLDHFVFGASKLAEGRAWMTDALGLPPVGAGAHAKMGTHNALWRVGSAYLEVIAVDPEAPAPDHPLWFGLSDAGTQRRIIDTPKLLTWVVAVEDIAETRARSPIDPGEPMAFTRDDLNWQLTVPPSGLPPENGAFPALIHWPAGVMSPAQSLPDQGLEIAAFAASGPRALEDALEGIGARALITSFRKSDAAALNLTVTSPETGTVHLA
ncbi:MAG: VOC family protein [Pseudomonadota bacterium]